MQARYTANPQFLKIKGHSATQDSYKAMLWSCILHTLTKTAYLYKFRSKKVLFNASRMAACEVVLVLAGSVFDIVGSYEQRDLPIWLIY